MERRWHAAMPLLVGSVGVFALLFHPQEIATAMVFFTMAGIAVSYFSAFWAIPTETLSHTAAAIAVGIVNASGSAGGFVGPYLFGYLNTRMGGPFYGLVFISLGWLAGGLLILRIPKRR
jgi:ACS family tartrate transporter-like MFS transporter